MYACAIVFLFVCCFYLFCVKCRVMKLYLTHSIRDSETFIDFVQGPPGSRRERDMYIDLNRCYDINHLNFFVV